ncbi:MAG: hypothetical protein LC781_22620 [Actinobacteria bacterium]|nr:hypothetical protein [Actinomycetota bacterium]
MLEANVHPRVVQEMLGHANIRQTMDPYSHVLPNIKATDDNPISYAVRTRT